MAYDSLMVFTGNANPETGSRCSEASAHFPWFVPTSAASRMAKSMSNSTRHVRGKDVFVLQSTCAPSNDNLMELLVMVDALKRASAGRITASIPYFGYARQDRRSRSSRVPMPAKLVANMLVAAGVAPRADDGPARRTDSGLLRYSGRQHLRAADPAGGHLEKQNYENLMVVSPDHGGVVRARSLAKRLECDLAIIDKRRPKANVSEVMNIIGEVDGRTCVIMDDIVDTAGTLCKAAQALKANGAKRVTGLLHAPGAVRRRPSAANDISDLDELVVTDTIPLSEEALACRAFASCRWRAAGRDDSPHQQ
jgi:ribose-phosphate pyrophosphokinase